MSSVIVFLDLGQLGNSVRCELGYEWEPADGDGWNEPRTEESISFRSATAIIVCGMQETELDIFPLLDAAGLNGGALYHEIIESMEKDNDC